jgi:hypothetical protein
MTQELTESKIKEPFASIKAYGENLLYAAGLIIGEIRFAEQGRKLKKTYPTELGDSNEISIVEKIQEMFERDFDEGREDYDYTGEHIGEIFVGLAKEVLFNNTGKALYRNEKGEIKGNQKLAQILAYRVWSKLEGQIFRERGQGMFVLKSDFFKAVKAERWDIPNGGMEK